MQMEKAEHLRKEWGDKECEHPDFSREYCLGANTGDYICTQCGQCFSREARDKIINSRG